MHPGGCQPCHEQTRRVAPPSPVNTGVYRCSMQPNTKGVDQRAYDPTAVAAAMQLSRFGEAVSDG